MCLKQLSVLFFRYHSSRPIKSEFKSMSRFVISIECSLDLLLYILQSGYHEKESLRPSNACLPVIP